MLENNEFVNSLAEVLSEFVTLTGVDWDKAYFRYVEYGPGHHSTQWSYVVNNNLELASLDIEFKQKYTDTLAALAREVSNELEAAGRARPVATVLEVDRASRYELKFDYEDTNGLEINKLALGKPNSYFYGTDINIPDEVIDFQNELAKRP